MLATLLTFAGLACICLSMKRHFRQWFPDRPFAERPALALRFGGYGLLVVATAQLVAEYGWGVGLPLLCGIVTVAAFAVGLATTLRVESQTRANPRS